MAKAWGVYSLKCGVPTILTGYNVCNYMTIPITGMRVANAAGTYTGTGAGNNGWNYPFVFYGIKLCSPVKWPYTLDMKFNPVGVFDGNVYSNTGLTTFGNYGTSIYGNSASYQPLVATMVNCAGNNPNGNYLTGDFKKMIYANDYNEVIFNLSPSHAINTTYYGVANSTSLLNGTGSFVIYSY